MTSTVSSTAKSKLPRAQTKTDRLLTLLKAGTGANHEEMIHATGWQPHTVSAALTGLRKRGFVIDRLLESSTTIWSATPAA